MKILIKYLSQFLLIPLIKEFASWLFKKFEDWKKERKERKALDEANREIQRKVDAYENSSPDDAFDVHP